MKNFIQNIFSIRNKNQHKVLTICGIRLKFKNKFLILNSKIEKLSIELNVLKKNYNKLDTNLNNVIVKLKTEIFKHIKYYESGIENNGNNNKVIIVDENGCEIYDKVIKGLKIKFNGNNNVIKIHKPLNKMKNCVIHCGNNNYVEIESTNNIVQNVFICSELPPYKMSDFSKIVIKKNFSCLGMVVNIIDESNLTLHIGEDCMFSQDIMIWPSDAHSIIHKETKKIINTISNKQLYIGNSVWVARGCSILKNASLPNNTVVASNSLVNKIFTEENTIIAGMPAKIVKNNIEWSRLNTERYMEMERTNG